MFIPTSTRDMAYKVFVLTPQAKFVVLSESLGLNSKSAFVVWPLRSNITIGGYFYNYVLGNYYWVLIVCYIQFRKL